MSKNKVKLDPKNFREHPEENQKLINKSLSELGAGRSILLDKDFFTIAGNGVLAEAEKLGIKVKVIDSDGSELIAIRRTDVSNKSKKRKQLALVDNSTTDLSRWNWSNIKDSWSENELQDWGVDYWVDEELDLDEFFKDHEEEINEKLGRLILEFSPKKYKQVMDALEGMDGTNEEIIYKLLVK